MFKVGQKFVYIGEVTARACVYEFTDVTNNHVGFRWKMIDGKYFSIMEDRQILENYIAEGEYKILDSVVLDEELFKL